jgi:hypothetical protein
MIKITLTPREADLLMEALRHRAEIHDREMRAALDTARDQSSRLDTATEVHEHALSEKRATDRAAQAAQCRALIDRIDSLQP